MHAGVHARTHRQTRTQTDKQHSIYNIENNSRIATKLKQKYNTFENIMTSMGYVISKFVSHIKPLNKI
jgi:hypothetical protein